MEILADASAIIRHTERSEADTGVIIIPYEVMVQWVFSAQENAGYFM
jgi:hypothetical protein